MLYSVWAQFYYIQCIWRENKSKKLEETWPKREHWYLLCHSNIVIFYFNFSEFFQILYKMNMYYFNNQKKITFWSNNKELSFLPSGQTHRKAGYRSSRNTGLSLQCGPRGCAVPWFMGSGTPGNGFDDPHFTGEEMKAQKTPFTCYSKNPHTSLEPDVHSVTRSQSLPTRIPWTGDSTFRYLLKAIEW